MVDDAMAKERPVLHQPKHGVSPFLLMKPDRVAADCTQPRRFGCIRNTAVRSAGRAPQGYRHVAAVQLENLQQTADGSAETPERKARDVMARCTRGGERARISPITRANLKAATEQGETTRMMGGPERRSMRKSPAGAIVD